MASIIIIVSNEQKYKTKQINMLVDFMVDHKGIAKNILKAPLCIETIQTLMEKN